MLFKDFSVPTKGNAVNEFVQRYGEKIMGVMSGFDRMWFRGTLRLIASVNGLLSYMRYREGGGGVLLKDFREWSLGITEQVKTAGRQAMEAAGRPVRYLNRSKVSKEELAREIMRQDGVRQGPVCLLEAVEPCRTYEIHRGGGRLSLQNKAGMCLHQYAYFMDDYVGLCHVRVQTWLPLEVKVSLNGRERLAMDLRREGIEHRCVDNCVTGLGKAEDFERVQEMLSDQVRTNWQDLLERLTRQANPALEQAIPLEGSGLRRYWSLEQSEWATDVLFKDKAELGRMYPVLAREAMLGMGSVDVLRFLGGPVSVNGVIPRNFAREVSSDMKVRCEQMRVRHRVGNNAVKMYDKQGVMVRCETTIHDPRGLRVYRGTEENPQDRKWRSCRKGVADVHRVAEVGQKANDRYLACLSKIDCSESVGDLLGPLCCGVIREGKRYRGLRVLEKGDSLLLEAVGRGEWLIQGFTNGQLREVLYKTQAADKPEESRRRGRVSRQLALLRAHGIVRRVSKTRRWMLTKKGQQVVALLAAAKHASAMDLLKKAA
jgi:hypothetical protein